MTKKEQRESTRRRILETGIRLFAHRGYNDTSMQDIARGVGMTTGVLYWHFRGKEDLLAAVLEHLFAGVFEKVIQPGAGIVSGNPVVTLRTMIGRVAKVVSDHPDWIQMIGVLSAETAEKNPRIERVLRQAYRQFAALIAELYVQANRLEAGHAPPLKDVDCVAQVFLGFYMGAVMQQRLFRRDLPISRMLPVLERMLLTAALPRGETPAERRARRR